MNLLFRYVVNLTVIAHFISHTNAFQYASFGKVPPYCPPMSHHEEHKTSRRVNICRLSTESVAAGLDDSTSSNRKSIDAVARSLGDESSESLNDECTAPTLPVAKYLGKVQSVTDNLYAKILIKCENTTIVYTAKTESLDDNSFVFGFASFPLQELVGKEIVDYHVLEEFRSKDYEALFPKMLTNKMHNFKLSDGLMFHVIEQRELEFSDDAIGESFLEFVPNSNFTAKSATGRVVIFVDLPKHLNTSYFKDNYQDKDNYSVFSHESKAKSNISTLLAVGQTVVFGRSDYRYLEGFSKVYSFALEHVASASQISIVYYENRFDYSYEYTGTVAVIEALHEGASLLKLALPANITSVSDFWPPACRYSSSLY